MPELPEVETIVRGLRPRLVGASIVQVWSSGLPLRMRERLDRRALARVCDNARIVAVRRRGKYILLDLHTPGAGVLVHLGMSGRLRLQPAGDAREKHTHVVWSLAGGEELRFSDPRRFGLVRPAADVDALVDLAGMGPDPLLDLSLVAFTAALASSRAPLKAFLLDQRRVAGLGNIYVCEALFRARLPPRLPARRALAHAEKLLRAIIETLEIAIGNRGTTLRDYVDADGGFGTNDAALQVYGRQGKPCLACGAAIKRRVDAGRSTFLCIRCQRR